MSRSSDILKALSAGDASGWASSSWISLSRRTADASRASSSFLSSSRRSCNGRKTSLPGLLRSSAGLISDHCICKLRIWAPSRSNLLATFNPLRSLRAPRSEACLNVRSPGATCRLTSSMSPRASTKSRRSERIVQPRKSARCMKTDICSMSPKSASPSRQKRNSASPPKITLRQLARPVTSRPRNDASAVERLVSKRTPVPKLLRSNRAGAANRASVKLTLLRIGGSGRNCEDVIATGPPKRTPRNSDCPFRLLPCSVNAPANWAPSNQARSVTTLFSISSAALQLVPRRSTLRKCERSIQSGSTGPAALECNVPSSCTSRMTKRFAPGGCCIFATSKSPSICTPRSSALRAISA